MLARAVIAEVVEVDAEKHGGVERGGDWFNRIHQSVFAMKAAVAVVHPIRRVLHFERLDFAPKQPPLFGKVGAIVAFRASERRRDRRYRNGVFGAESIGSDVGEQSRVDTATEGHDDPFELAKLGAQRLESFHPTSVVKFGPSSLHGERMIECSYENYHWFS